MPHDNYENDAEAWNATVAVAYPIAARAVQFKRAYRSDERRQVDTLIANAERALGLVGIPREPDELVAYVNRQAVQYNVEPATANAGGDDATENSLVDRPAPATTRPDPVDDVRPARVWMSAADLARKYGVSTQALAARLKRWRKLHDDGWDEVVNRRSRGPTILYVEAAVLPVIQQMPGYRHPANSQSQILPPF